MLRLLVAFVSAEIAWLGKIQGGALLGEYFMDSIFDYSTPSTCCFKNPSIPLESHDFSALYEHLKAFSPPPLGMKSAIFSMSYWSISNLIEDL